MRSLLAAAILLMAITANPSWADDRYGGRPSRSSGIYGRTADPVGQTLRDVQHVWSRSRVDGHERRHFERTIESLEQFQYRASRGHFDRGRLDRAIDNLEHLAHAGQIHPQGRQLLRQRLFDLHSFREDGRRW